MPDGQHPENKTKREIMKKSICYRANAVCNCDCDKPFTECEVVKQADALQKQYNFGMSIHYKATQSEHTIDIDTIQLLPFFLKQLTECAQNCRQKQR